MPYGKSVLVSMSITLAGRAHNCRFNDKHRIEKGMSRLTIKQDGDEHHYCLACAQSFLAKGSVKLHEIQTEVGRLLQSQ
jgi:hypothetical protein